MKVRILSGNNAGAVVEMDKTEAEVNIATGYAEAVSDEPAPKVEPVVVFESAPMTTTLPEETLLPLRGRRH